MPDKLKELRSKWPKELERFTDDELQKENSWFKNSEFIDWLVMTDG